MVDALPDLPAVRPRRRRDPWAIAGLVLLGLLALVVALFVWVYHQVSVPDDGDRIARDLGEQVATELADDVGSPHVASAETLAARVLDENHAIGAAGAVDVVVLGWDGTSGDDEGARVDVAVSVRVPGHTGVGFFDPGQSGGSSTACWRLVVRAYQHDDAADRESLPCPADLVGVTPEPEPLPSLGPDDADTVLQVLDGLPAGATAGDATAALGSAFPEADVRARREGRELVATVGVVRARDCVVAVRPDGEPAWRFSDFDRILLEPGEVGCDPNLYLYPVTTH